jgi:hypothetical protein
MGVTTYVDDEVSVRNLKRAERMSFGKLRMTFLIKIIMVRTSAVGVTTCVDDEGSLPYTFVCKVIFGKLRVTFPSKMFFTRSVMVSSTNHKRKQKNWTLSLTKGPRTTFSGNKPGAFRYTFGYT